MTKALIVVDVQNDFCEGGSLAVAGGSQTAAGINALLNANPGYDYVVATRDHHIDPGAHFGDPPDYVDSWPPHCVVGTPGVEIHENLTGQSFDAVFDKGEYSAAYSGFEGACAGVALEAWLAARNVEVVDVCGIATDYCVRATALDAAARGFATTVLLGLTAAVAPANVPGVLSEFAAAGVAVKPA
ncbi:MAG: isochorismatase family protein [Propionibacteriaceae bacterium]|nr:isochorismatase family protein [Propionibacteriaceae bacterium]